MTSIIRRKEIMLGDMTKTHRKSPSEPPERPDPRKGYQRRRDRFRVNLTKAAGL